MKIMSRSFIAFSFGVLALAAPASAQSDKPVVDQILQILLDRQQITDSEYDALRAKAKQEREDQAASIAKAAEEHAREQVVAAQARAEEAERRAAAAEAALHQASGATVAAVALAEANDQRAPPALEIEEAEAVEVGPEGAVAEEVVVASTEEPDLPGDTFRVYWKDGVRFETADQDFKFRIGGRMQLDVGVLGPSGAIQDEFDIDSLESGVRFRRARIYLSGTFYKILDFKFQYGFAGGEVGFKDVYVALKKVPYLQRIQVGHFKEPFSLEQLTSSNDITFMERSLQSPFEIGRNTGIGAFMTFFDKRMTFATGGFRIANNLGDSFGSSSPYSIAARVTGLPWYEDDGRYLLHLGLSYAHDFYNNYEVRYRARPSTGLGQRLVDTGEFLTDDGNFIDPELALVVGPFSFQAEYLQTLINQEELGDPRFFGWYTEASYFLTGEHRPYNTQKGAFTRVKPRRNFGFGEGSGWGAFQVGARYSVLNLNSGAIEGGRLQDVTLGLNWYLNPVSRIMFNYVYGSRNPAGSTNVYQMRFQLAF